MRILTVCSYYFPHVGGIEQTARDIVNALKGEHEQRVVCFNHEKGDRTDEVDGVKVDRAGCFAKISSQSLSLHINKLLRRVFKEFRPEVVVFHYPNPFLAHYLLKCLKKFPNCKLVLYWHLDITKQKILGKFFVGQSKRLLSRAAKVVATSPNYIEGSKFLGMAREKCIVIPSCVNKERVSYSETHEKMAEEIKAQAAGKTVLFALGRHVAYKGLDHLIRASAMLSDGFLIFIGGEGKLTESLKEAAKGDKKIKFLGRIDDDTVKAYLLACDIFCFPSITKNEAFGLALAEAMFFQKPCITFTIEGSGVNYVSLNGVTGIEVPNCDDKAYAEAIKTLANDETLRLKYGKAALLRARENFSGELYSERVRTLIQAL